MSERDADPRAEMPERPRRVGGGTAEVTGFARHADTARDEQAGDGGPTLMEEALCRENLLAAHARLVRNGGAQASTG